VHLAFPPTSTQLNKKLANFEESKKIPKMIDSKGVPKLPKLLALELHRKIGLMMSVNLPKHLETTYGREPLPT